MLKTIIPALSLMTSVCLAEETPVPFKHEIINMSYNDFRAFMDTEINFDIDEINEQRFFDKPTECHRIYEHLQEVHTEKLRKLLGDKIKPHSDKRIKIITTDRRGIYKIFVAPTNQEHITYWTRLISIPQDDQPLIITYKNSADAKEFGVYLVSLKPS